MGNELPKNLYTGTIGEIFVQLCLLEFGIQAAPPLKDTGNDLIAIKGRVVKFIQIKTSVNNLPISRDLPKIYDLVCLVNLIQDESRIYYDKSKISVIDNQGKKLGELNPNLVTKIWG
jgi:hypothetical protein